jgi:hypothetical protein
VGYSFAVLLSCPVCMSLHPVWRCALPVVLPSPYCRVYRARYRLSLQYWEGILFLIQYSVVRVETCVWVRHFPRRQTPFDEWVHTALPMIHFLVFAVSSSRRFQGYSVCMSALQGWLSLPPLHMMLAGSALVP